MTIPELMAFCRRLPHATEDVKWGDDLVFSIGGKMFAVFDRKDGQRFSFKTTPGSFAVLTTRSGISPAPYLARFHWVSVESPSALTAAEIKALLRESYHLVALSLPSRVRKALGATGA